MNEYAFGTIEDTTEFDQIYPSNPLDRLDRLYHSAEFESLLEASRADVIDASKLDTILEFISVQCGDWFSHWVCSPATRPDFDAQAEFDNWELLWRAFVQSEFKNSPDRLEVVTWRHIRQRDFRLLRYVNRSRRSKSLKRTLTGCCYWISRFLGSMGLTRAADRFFGGTIYPKGSVGRG